jgi:hypothetical protein
MCDDRGRTIIRVYLKFSACLHDDRSTVQVWAHEYDAGNGASDFAYIVQIVQTIPVLDTGEDGPISQPDLVRFQFNNYASAMKHVCEFLATDAGC